MNIKLHPIQFVLNHDLHFTGPNVILPEHAPRDEAAKIEEARGENSNVF